MFFTREGCGGHCGHNTEGHHCRHEHEHGEGHHHCHHEEADGHSRGCCGHGGRREGAGRKKNCERIPFNRRLSEESINLIKEYAQKNNITETEALEKAIQSLKE
ncbi:unknown [Brachyspira sp. CAG:484]|nr:unknown [Brachyspira sp. CAG:484]